MKITDLKSGAFLVLAVEGRLDTLTAPEFEAEGLRRAQAGEARLVLDLAGVDYISSAGLRGILAVAKRLKAKGGDLAVCGLRGIVAEVFTVSGFAKILPVFATREDALDRE